MRGETVAEGGRKHACPVGVSKIRARRSVESLLKRPLAEILSSTAPAVVLVKEESRRSTAPVAKEVSRRRKPHRSMWLHARLVDASTARYLLVRVPQRQGSQNRDRLDHGLLTSRPRLAATGITPRACAHPYIHITAVEARRALFPLALVARNGLARTACGSVFLRHMGHRIAGQRVGHLDTKGGARVRAGSQLAVWLVGWPRRLRP